MFINSLKYLETSKYLTRSIIIGRHFRTEDAYFNAIKILLLTSKSLQLMTEFDNLTATSRQNTQVVSTEYIKTTNLVVDSNCIAFADYCFGKSEAIGNCIIYYIKQLE